MTSTGTDFELERTGFAVYTWATFPGKAHIGLLFVSPSKWSRILALRHVPFAVA